jgi:hypothetical protein
VSQLSWDELVHLNEAAISGVNIDGHSEELEEWE